MSEAAPEGAGKKRRTREPRRAAGPLRRLRHAAIVPLLDATRWIAMRLSHRNAIRVGAALGSIGWFFARRTRRIAEAQLLQAGIAETPDAARRISHEVFRSVGMGSIEWLHASNWSVEHYLRVVSVEGEEHLQTAHAAGRGTIFVSLHMGNFEFLPLIYEALTRRPICAVMTEQRNKSLNDWIVKARNKSSFHIIPSERAGMGVLRHLRRGGAVGLMADQDSRRVRGIFVPFFGRLALTPIGPALFARRGGVAIITAALIRDPADPTRHICTIGAPLWTDPALDEDADITRLTTAFTAQMEAVVRRAPGQWVWFHKRWKHQPGRNLSLKA